MKNIRLILAALILLFFIILVDAVFIEPYNLKVTENDFDLFEGNDTNVKIVLISDIHIASQLDGYLENVVKKINEENADLILIVGDSINGQETELEDLEPLRDLKAKYGKYAVLGNHDYKKWQCPVPKSSLEMGDKTEKRLEDLGIKVFRNDNEILEIKGKKFALIGLDDAWVCKNDYAKASEGISKDIPKVIFMHNQEAIDLKLPKGKSAILAGHTHCGQIQIPFITQFLLKSNGFGEYGMGRVRVDEYTELYVTCGVTRGSTVAGIAIRLFTNPEISVININ